MTDWATSGRVKIERAKEHIANLETEIPAFGKGDFYTAVPNIDKQTGEVVIRLRVRERPPPRWGAVAGDAVHNLRSALNILWRTVWSVTVRDENRKDSFRIFDSADAFKTRFRGKQQGGRQPVVDILQALKPYKGGNDLLWMLEEINNTDKHRMLIPILMNFGGTVTLTPSEEEPTVYDMRLRNPIYPVEDGAELFRIPPPTRGGQQMRVDVQFVLPVAFGEPEVARGQAIIPTLHQLAGVVDGIVETFTRAGLLS